nr:hypothetical transcript [Hymenolepis microstoma]
MRLRESVRPTASNMKVLSYSYYMQELSQEWVSKCNTSYESTASEHFEIRKNVAITYADQAPEMVKLAGIWESEKENFHYSQNSIKTSYTNANCALFFKVENMGIEHRTFLDTVAANVQKTMDVIATNA